MKQTQSENGSVTRTRPQEMAVNSHPQSPMPLSDSSAEKKRKKLIYFAITPLLFSFHTIFFAIENEDPAHKSRAINPVSAIAVVSFQRESLALAYLSGAQVPAPFFAPLRTPKTHILVGFLPLKRAFSGPFHFFFSFHQGRWKSSSFFLCDNGLDSQVCL